ncbi:efflux RND transporter permease subunit [Clostridium aminobutyricum]|uniref:Efflux RND transporter permease subunit n=1 Tax=Clostridium aminobutyricum TaxID=33953 RepID=A0A939D8N6_CLOAM|nr:efflux RND transporter permease subunit [Clostridium aminobutyricum]MBN7773449.1 efflux RND transporter permease subunit [Clostridium aminobutyricum]
MFITDISLKRPTFAIVVIIALLAAGIISFMGLNLNEQPETNLPYTAVIITLPGASPDQMESKVTKIVEDNVGQISGVKHLISRVSEGYSLTVIEFDDSRTVDDAAQDVRSKLGSIRSLLPNDINEPVVSKINMNEMPVLSLTVAGDLSSVKLSNLVDNTIVPKLNSISGVGSVTTYGLMEREIQIKVDKDKLAAFNLTIGQIISGLSSDNIDIPSGKVADDSREVTLRTYSSIKNVEGFNDIIVATINGTEVRLGDVAEVIDGYEARDSISFYNGEECIGIDIVKQSGTNTVEVVDEIKSQMEALEASLPAGVSINVVSDNSTSIRASVHSVEETLIEGCLLAVAIIFLFLRTWGSTLVSAISLPTSIITTFAAMKIMGFSLNMMSLMALSLSVGLLVDDAIVVIENIVRHLRMGKTPIQAAKEATSEISLAVLATTLTIVAVFLPMSMMNGILGSFFKEFGLTIAFAVLISLFISFTLVPLLASRYVKDDEDIEPRTKFGRFLHWFNYQFDLLAGYYKNILSVVLRNRKKTIAVTVALFVASIALIPLMGMSFIPSQDKGIITIAAELDSGLSLDAATERAKKIEDIVNQYKDVQSVYTTIEKDSISLSIDLTDKKDRKESSDEIASQMRAEIKVMPGLDLSVAGTSGMSSSSAKAYAIHIQGEDFDQLLEYSQKAKQLLNDIPGAVDVGISYKAGKPETRIVVDRDAAADLGVAPSSISSTLGILFNGTTVGQYESGGDRIDVKVSVQDDQSTSLDSINGIYLASTTTGRMIPIEQLISKEYGTASSQIARYDKSRDIEIQANFIGLTSSELNSAFMDKLNKELPPPKGITIGAGSDQQFMEESAGGLVQAFILGILFIFLILAAQFESWLDPFAIMFSLPLAIIGAILAMFLKGDGLSMVGLIGIFFLMGLVTKNAILLVDFIKKRREEGSDRKEAILEAAMIRLRPIMMTTLAMIFGMLPSALNSGTGSEIWQPMAVAIIGGLISSTLLTLFVIPVIYTILDDIKGKLRSVKSKARDNILTKTKRVS